MRERERERREIGGGISRRVECIRISSRPMQRGGDVGGGGGRCNAHPSIRSRRSIHPSYHLYPRSRAIRTLPSNPHSHLSPLPRRSFFSISPFFLGASFFFKPFDSNWFLSRPLIRTSFVLSLSVLFSSSHFFVFFFFFFCFFAPFSPSSPLLFSFSIVCRYECEFVLPCRFVRTNALSYFWLPRGRRQGEGGIRERKAHDDVRRGSCRNFRLNQTFARFIAHSGRTLA